MDEDDWEPFPLDGLTGLPCRGALEAQLRESGDMARRSGQCLSVLAIDLDHFQELNARHMHFGGDQLLAGVASVLVSLVRPGQSLFRDGGDQFTFILAGADRDEAYREAERIRQAVAAAQLEVRCGDTAELASVTVSIGIATLTSSDTDAWELFFRARDAVHRAKDAGRNRVA